MTQLIRFDWAIKHILRDKANFDILEGFLSELIGDDLKIQEVLESESNQASKKDKFNRVDLLVKNSQGDLIIVEVQNELEYDYFQRMLYGTSKAVVENISLGQTYENVKKIIMVTIVYFDLGQGDDYVYHGTTNFIGRHKRDELKLNESQQAMYGKQRVCDLYPEYYALKVEQFDDVIREQLDEWIYFLKHEQIKPEFAAKGLQQAKEKLDFLKMTPDERWFYKEYLEDLRYMASMVNTYKAQARFEREAAEREAKAKGKAEGLAIGKAEGKLEGKLEGRLEGMADGQAKIIRAMLERGLTIAEIAEMTGLAPSEIETLKQIE